MCSHGCHYQNRMEVIDMRLIDADALYEQLQKDEELARKRVLDTESYLPYPNNLNPSYTRYVAQMDERTRLKHIVADAHTIEPGIIRCRNCKFASGDSRICMQFGHSPIGELDFCAWAERDNDG